MARKRTWNHLKEHGKELDLQNKLWTQNSKDTTLPSVGPKRKTKGQTQPHTTSSDKKQKLDEKTCTLGKIMADNLGSTVAAWQHYRV